MGKDDRYRADQLPLTGRSSFTGQGGGSLRGTGRVRRRQALAWQLAACASAGASMLTAFTDRSSACMLGNMSEKHLEKTSLVTSP